METVAEHEASWEDAKENAELSIEFCGGVHVPTTQAAEAFALLSEEATAKGIRRITAVTGAAAKKAIAAGEALLAQAHAAGKLADDAMAKEVAKMKAVVAEAVIPAAQKAEVNDVLAQLGKKLLEAAKKAQAANKEKALGLLEEAVRATTAAGGAFALLQVEVGLDAKALQKAVAAAQKVNAALPMMVVSADAGKDKAEAGATAVIQPGGSMRDDEVISAADDAGLSMVFTGMRHFRH